MSKYIASVASEQHGVEVHSFTLLSTHEHLVVTDVRGAMRDFLRDFHRYVALCM
ncbi:MAG: hypothetical protein MJD61_16470 [Proteobacteria bacterium]|nr:hypothetical protein [Pseudomonadota bacterium]